LQNKSYQMRAVLRSLTAAPSPSSPVADADIVCARESQLAIIANAEHRQAGGYGLDGVAVPHIHRQIVLRDQQASARVDAKGSRVDLLGFDVLNRCQLAGGLIDCVHNDGFSPPLKTCLP
jgi:hypothetical protein